MASGQMAPSNAKSGRKLDPTLRPDSRLAFQRQVRQTHGTQGIIFADEGEANNQPKNVNSLVIKARRATQRKYCPKAKKARPPKGKTRQMRPSMKDSHDKRRGVDGGETVCSDWLQQEDRKIGEKKHDHKFEPE